MVTGTTSFPEKHTADAISRALLKIRLKYGLHPVVPRDQVMTESEMEADPVRAFQDESPCDRVALTTDCASNMSSAAEKKEIFDWHPCICHLLNTAVKAAFDNVKEFQQLVQPLRELASHFHRSPAAWKLFRRVQRKVLKEEGVGDVSSDEEEEDYSGVREEDDVAELPDDPDAGLTAPDNEMEQACPKRILRLGTWCPTRWNSMYFLIKRAVLLERSIREYTANARIAKIIIPAAGWCILKQVLPVLESIRELSERCEGDEYITISDVLYNVLKLLYDRLYVTDTDAHAKPVLLDFTSEFTKKLCADCDNVNLIYCWALAAAVDGRRNTLHWMRRIWNNADDWPKLVKEYDTLAKFQAMLKKEMTALVSSVLICGLCLCKCVHPTVDSFGRYQVSFVPLHARLCLACILP